VVDYARVANGAAVKEGGKKYDISTVAKLKDALLEAKTIGHSNAGTGPFNTRMFQKMGIYDQIKDKVRITMGGKLVAQALIDGDFEFGIQQTNVIQPFPGTIYLGPLPDELLEYATSSVGLLAVSKHPEEAKAFMKYMADPANAGLLRKGAMFPLS
jgi:molybdate transport system substrate-binding protein